SAPAKGGRRNDPLAELARLIGKEDPFAALGRERAPAAQRQAPEAVPEWHSRSGYEPHGQPEYDDRSFAADAHAYDAERYHDAPYRAGARYEDPAYPADDQGYAPEAYYDDGQAYAEEGYEEAQPARRRGGLTTVAAVIGLIALGTAGVFGYRAWTAPS